MQIRPRTEFFKSWRLRVDCADKTQLTQAMKIQIQQIYNHPERFRWTERYINRESYAGTPDTAAEPRNLIIC